MLYPQKSHLNEEMTAPNLRSKFKQAAWMNLRPMAVCLVTLFTTSCDSEGLSTVDAAGAPPIGSRPSAPAF